LHEGQFVLDKTEFSAKPVLRAPRSGLGKGTAGVSFCPVRPMRLGQYISILELY